MLDEGKKMRVSMVVEEVLKESARCGRATPNF